MRRLAIAVPLALLLAAPAHAADQTVRATTQSTFTPNSVTISPGDTVTWVNDGGIHNVRFDDGSYESPASPSFTWTTNPERTFNTPGEFRYFCEQHGAAGGSGMAGRVIVEGATQPPPPGGSGADTTPPDIDNLRLVPSRFCNKKTSRCNRVGTSIRFDLDEDARISGRIVNRRTGKKAGSMSITATAGANDFDYSGRGLRLGKYQLQLTPRDTNGNKAPKPTRANFTITAER